MKRFLFVTETFPEDMRTAVYGIYQRMRMFTIITIDAHAAAHPSP